MRKKAAVYLATEKKLLASFYRLTKTYKKQEIKGDSGENLDELFVLLRKLEWIQTKAGKKAMARFQKSEAGGEVNAEGNTEEDAEDDTELQQEEDEEKDDDDAQIINYTKDDLRNMLPNNKIFPSTYYPIGYMHLYYHGGAWAKSKHKLYISYIYKHIFYSTFFVV